MLDITTLRKDLDAVVARLNTRKNPQAFLNVAAFQALEAERKAIQVRTEDCRHSATACPNKLACSRARARTPKPLP